MKSFLLLFLLLLLIAVFFLEMRHSLRRSALTNRLIVEKDDPAKCEEILGAIYRHCLSDWKLRRVMKKYGATREDLRQLQEKLRKWGDFEKGRRYIPISSFFYVYTLEYLLRYKDSDAKTLTVKCMNFFHM